MPSPAPPLPTGKLTPPGPTAPPGNRQLEPDAAVRVVVAELNVRREPRISSARDATVPRGAVFLLKGFDPIRADGYTWWFAMQVATLGDGGLPPLPSELESAGVMGYIAVRSGGTAYVERLPARCPAVADLEGVSAMLSSERSACFGATSLTLEGTYGCPVCESMEPYDYEPVWLAAPSLRTISVDVDGYAMTSWLELFVAPGATEPARGDIVRMRGHFNDSRSTDCSIRYRGFESGEPERAIDDTIATALCRQHFVVEGFDVIGQDPEYPRE